MSAGRHSRGGRVSAETGGWPGRATRGARGRSGRTFVDGWTIALGAVLVVAVVAVAARAFVRPGTSEAAARGSAAAKASTARAGSRKDAATAVFAKMKRYGVALHYPATPADMVAIGFHQAWNAKATEMLPVATPHPRDKYESTKQALVADPSLKAFLMMSRGRGSSQYSAADCAVKPGAIVLSPVTGTVTVVKKYKLEGNIDDFRVEIEADGAKQVRVVMIHIQDLVVKQGDRLVGGVSPVATVRHLAIDSQVNRYLPVPADHTHVQINDVGYRLNEAS